MRDLVLNVAASQLLSKLCSLIPKDSCCLVALIVSLRNCKLLVSHYPDNSACCV